MLECLKLDTDDEEDNDEGLEDDLACDTGFTIKDLKNLEIEQAVDMSDSALISETCQNESEATFLSASTSLVSSTPPTLKRKRRPLSNIPAEINTMTQKDRPLRVPWIKLLTVQAEVHCYRQHCQDQATNVIDLSRKMLRWLANLLGPLQKLIQNHVISKIFCGGNKI